MPRDEAIATPVVQLSGRLEHLLQVLIHVIARATLPEAKLNEIVGERAAQLRAFNLADGTRTQAEIARKARIDQGSLSRTCARWVEAGAAYWIGEGSAARLVHIYKLPTAQPRRTAKKHKKAAKKNAARRGRAR